MSGQPDGFRERGGGPPPEVGITVFASPKPFLDPHVSRIQRNALRSWLTLGPCVEVLVVGDEAGVSEVAAEHGVRHLPRVERNELGTPLLDSIFRLAEQAARYPVLCYVNADIILLPDFVDGVGEVSRRFDRFLIIGRRWDLEVSEDLTFEAHFAGDLRKRLADRGSLHPPTGSDYFVYPRGMFRHLPAFALGRAGWDNWMIFAGRRARVPVVDATGAITAIHQAHDYRHLPGGQPHYRLPESRRNVEMVGGRATVFTILDATWAWGAQGLERKPWSTPGTGRALESRIYAFLGRGPLVRVARLLLHPRETFRYYGAASRRRIARWLSRSQDEARR